MAGSGIKLDLIARAEAIDGWQLPSEIRWLAETALGCETALEIGSYCGRSTFAIASHLSGNEPYMACIDDWRGEVDRPGKTGYILFNEWTENLKDYAFVEPYAVDTTKITDAEIDELRVAVGDGFDLIFVDGSHDSASVVRDCEVADALAGEHTIICGHDYFNPDVRAGVYHHYVAGQGKKISNPAGSIWMVE